MALDIMIVTDPTKPYWHDEGAVRFGEIDPVEWETLLFKEIGVLSYPEFVKEKERTEEYEDYYSKQIYRLQTDFPMIARIRDYYSDALFRVEEIKVLKTEVLSFKRVVKLKESERLLNQILAAIEIAIKKRAGILLVAD